MTDLVEKLVHTVYPKFNNYTQGLNLGSTIRSYGLEIDKGRLNNC